MTTLTLLNAMAAPAIPGLAKTRSSVIGVATAEAGTAFSRAEAGADWEARPAISAAAMSEICVRRITVPKNSKWRKDGRKKGAPADCQDAFSRLCRGGQWAFLSPSWSAVGVGLGFRRSCGCLSLGVAGAWIATFDDTR